MANTTKLGLPKITDNMSADVVRDINALADGIDAKVGVAGGLAVLDEKGNVGGVDTSKLATKDEVVAHKNDYAAHTPYATTTGTADTYNITLNPALSSYTEGFSIRAKINVDNTGATTLNINGLGAKSIKKGNGADVNAGMLKTGSVYTLSYNGTAFILQGEGSELSDTEKASLINAVNGILGA